MAGARAAVLSMQTRRISGLSMALGDVKRSGSYNRLSRLGGGTTASGRRKPSGVSLLHKDDNGHVLPESSKYGIRLTSDETVHQRYKDRSYWQSIRIKLCDYSFFLGAIGLALAVLITELQASKSEFYQNSYLELCLKYMVVLSTTGLLVLVSAYHYVEIQISLVETGYDHWWVGLTKNRVLRLLAELLICSICPLPGTGIFHTPLLGAPSMTCPSPGTSVVVPVVSEVPIPLDVLLCLPMFLRGYLFCRFLVLHSKQYQDPSTRTIASLNQVAMDLPFVIRTKLTDHPIRMLSIITVVFWLCIAWMLTQCERYADDTHTGVYHLLNYIWFVIVTFFSIGYGDVVPNTFCGRTLAITVGIVGTLVSSTLIAVIGRLMQLSLAEQRVNRLIAETNLNKAYKHSAACVLQHTWQIHRYTQRIDEHPKEMTRLRYHQRSLWLSILRFRNIRWKSRMLAEQIDDILAITKMQNEVRDRMSDFVRKQTRLQRQVDSVNQGILEIQAVLGAGSTARAGQGATAPSDGGEGAPPPPRRESSASGVGGSISPAGSSRRRKHTYHGGVGVGGYRGCSSMIAMDPVQERRRRVDSDDTYSAAAAPARRPRTICSMEALTSTVLSASGHHHGSAVAGGGRRPLASAYRHSPPPRAWLATAKQRHKASLQVDSYYAVDRLAEGAGVASGSSQQEVTNL